MLVNFKMRGNDWTFTAISLSFTKYLKLIQLQVNASTISSLFNKFLKLRFPKILFERSQ